MAFSNSKIFVACLCAVAVCSSYVTAATTDQCSINEFQCSNGDCIPAMWICDIIADCPFREDELFCCSNDKFNCHSGRCIDMNRVCDGKEDCDDGDDEGNCGVSTCSQNEYTCPNSSLCIPEFWVCDNIDDCSGREDELRCCTDEQFNCNDGTCIELSMVCNGNSDCNDGEDELDEHCEDFDICATDANNCHEHATCVGLSHSLTCECNEGHYGDGVLCYDIDECSEGSHNCSTDAACNNTHGGFTCKCNTGFVGNGVSCLDVDECKTDANNCHENDHATCINVPGSFECTCMDGYHGDGISCSDINECMVNRRSCDYYATCTNTEGSFTCQCNTGYTGDGLYCEDVDECNATALDCHDNATCINTAGSYLCDCNAGFIGDGVSCTDIDECTDDTHNCDALATCSNTIGYYECQCYNGLEGDGFSCHDVDECDIYRPRHNCHDYAICINKFGLYDCECSEGFSGNGFKCHDVDECKDANDCSPYAACYNSIGSYRCVCYAGYKGDGKTCTPIVAQLGSLRLRGGSKAYEGRVEILARHDWTREYTWSPICDHEWDDQDAVVACKHLGYPHGFPMAIRGSHFGPNQESVVMDFVQCFGDEENLRDCRHQNIEITCGMNEQAGVICTNHSNIRLADKKETTYTTKGRVQIMKNGLWGNVCDRSWDDVDAQVVCRQLGLPYIYARSYIDPLQPTQTSEWFAIDQVECYGDEQELHRCHHTSHVSSYCNFAGIICSDGLAIDAKPDLFDTGICGTRAGIAGRIAGGQDAEPSSWPWAATLIITKMDDRYRLCAASLINNDWAITTAHCIPDRYKGLLLIFGDTSIRGQSEYRVEIGATPICHPYYNDDPSNGYRSDNDICLLKLHGNVTYNQYIRPVCLSVSQDEMADYGSCYVVGWGIISENGPISYEQQELATNLISKSECERFLPFSISDNTICAKTGSEPAPCPGDSGGPLICQNGPDSWHLVGITTFAFDCGYDGMPAGFARMSRYTRWIYRTVAEYESE